MEPEPAPPAPVATVKTVKKALGSYIRFINAHPEALKAYFADDDPGLKAARLALKRLRGAWQSLSPQTPVQELSVALHSMKAELHGQLNFQALQCQPAAIPELSSAAAAELSALWSEYLRVCRALRMDTQVAATQAILSAVPAGQDLTQLPGFTPIDQMQHAMEAPARQAEAEARRAAAQAARIDAAQDEMIRRFESGELSDDQLPTEAIFTACPTDLKDLIKSWAVAHPQLGFHCLTRLVTAAQNDSWAWFEAADILTERPVIQAIVDCVAACAELPLDEGPDALGGYSVWDLNNLAMTGLGLLLNGTGPEGARWSESTGGMTAKHVMMQTGVLEMAAANLRQVDRPQLHHTAAHLIASICFGASERCCHCLPFSYLIERTSPPPLQAMMVGKGTAIRLLPWRGENTLSLWVCWKGSLSPCRAILEAVALAAHRILGC